MWIISDNALCTQHAKIQNSCNNSDTLQIIKRKPSYQTNCPVVSPHGLATRTAISAISARLLFLSALSSRGQVTSVSKTGTRYRRKQKTGWLLIRVYIHIYKYVTGKKVAMGGPQVDTLSCECWKHRVVLGVLSFCKETQWGFCVCVTPKFVNMLNDFHTEEELQTAREHNNA